MSLYGNLLIPLTFVGFLTNNSECRRQEYEQLQELTFLKSLFRINQFSTINKKRFGPVF
ncbi:hypothetical protein GCM10027189_17110 [Rufibacter soli]